MASTGVGFFGAGGGSAKRSARGGIANSAPYLRTAAGQHFNQSIEIILTFVERFHENPFVLSVCPDVVDITREPGAAIRRNAGVSSVASISGPPPHRWKTCSACPKLLRYFRMQAHDLLLTC